VFDPISVLPYLVPLPPGDDPIAVTVIIIIIIITTGDYSVKRAIIHRVTPNDH
jgi:hypothetical protein